MQCRGAKSFVDDLGLSRGVVLGRAAASLRSIETKPFDWQICPPRWTHLPTFLFPSERVWSILHVDSWRRALLPPPINLGGGRGALFYLPSRPSGAYSTRVLVRALLPPPKDLGGGRGALFYLPPRPSGAYSTLILKKALLP